MNLCRSNLIPFYLVLSAANGIMPSVIALLLSVPAIYALAIWVLTTAATFALISLVCMRTAWKNVEQASSQELGSTEFEKEFAAFR